MGKTLQKVKVSKVNEMPKNLGKTVTIGPYEIALFHLANGEFRAIENRCPHKGGVLVEGIVSGDHVFCPMHDWKISVSNGEVQKPDNGCVKTFNVEIEEGDVYIVL
ncbi:nitrite reductase small subunit NirD [Bacillus sp. SD075]|uniref:nitrite reductase small subunit NirD n=1 Tax=Bacillus sp. SD075 TaxID=2781732 RepID=UPI001A973213|nr:nitrite reductase small subunit NirD [Bacillus sp. SD075]MBO0998591.1 nitrite reductase small subunit NirD [Bacillus sp. SD075]